MYLITEIMIVMGICLAGEAVAAVLPFAFPSSVISMLFLLVLLLARVLKPHHIARKSQFLLSNMALFFVPAGVGMLAYLQVLVENALPILAICAITTPLVFFVTGKSVQWTMRLMERGKKHE